MFSLAKCINFNVFMFGIGFVCNFIFNWIIKIWFVDIFECIVIRTMLHLCIRCVQRCMCAIEFISQTRQTDIAHTHTLVHNWKPVPVHSLACVHLNALHWKWQCKYLTGRGGEGKSMSMRNLCPWTHDMLFVSNLNCIKFSLFQSFKIWICAAAQCSSELTQFSCDNGEHCHRLFYC